MRPLAFAVALSATTCAPETRALPPCDASSAIESIAKSATVVTIAAVGDVADCDGGKQMAVASIVERMKPDAVLAMGDLAYPDGAIADFLDCYGPSLGRFRRITRAAPGNHEYHTPHAGAYYAYFCGSSGEPFKGWYSFDVGRWHVVALNSNCGQDLDVVSDVASDFGGCTDGSPQIAWLRADLDAHRGQCTIAMWHHPRWSSSSEGSSHEVDTIFRVVAEHGVDIVLNGHAHDYQRFPHLGADGTPSQAGPRVFVVGTGGSSLSSFDDDSHDRSEFRDNGSHGALRLELRERSYAWSFAAVDGDPLRDEGEDSCH
ncbi:MAG: metallophosphoesterase family protein [Polyangiales bacterium]